MAAQRQALRVLAALRQSKHRKGHTADTSPDMQREHIDNWAAFKGHTVIGEAVDLDVSGRKVSPWDRPELGRWLSERSGEFDAICIDSVDRAGRHLEAFLRFQSKYLDPYGKSLHFVTPDVDLSTPEGQHTVNSLMAVAQLQSDQLADKMSDVSAHVRAKGRHSGGLVPYGYRLVKFDVPGYGYEIDPEPAAIVRQAADRFLAGSSLNAITRWLNNSGIPSPTGKQWSAQSVQHTLTSPAIAGIMGKSGERVNRRYQRNAKADWGPLYSTSGEMVEMVKAPGVPTGGIVSVGEWQAILATVKANGHNGPRSNGSHLLHVTWCGHCGAPLYSAPQVSKGRTYRYMKCSRKTRPEIPGECSNPVIRAELVEQALSDTIMAELGDVPMKTKKVTPADDKGKALEFVETQLAGLVEAIVNGTMSPQLAGAAEARLRAKREQLISEAHPEVVEWIPSGITFGQHWESMDWPERHAFLVRNGVKVSVLMPGRGPNKEVLAKYDRKPLPPSLWFPTLSLEAGPGTGSDVIQAGRHVVIVWLGELESLRKSASVKPADAT
jgi:site-specific DNA recombinase